MAEPIATSFVSQHQKILEKQRKEAEKKAQPANAQPKKNNKKEQEQGGPEEKKRKKEEEKKEKKNYLCLPIDHPWRKENKHAKQPCVPTDRVGWDDAETYGDVFHNEDDKGEERCKAKCPKGGWKPAVFSSASYQQTMEKDFVLRLGPVPAQGRVLGEGSFGQVALLNNASDLVCKTMKTRDYNDPWTMGTKLRSFLRETCVPRFFHPNFLNLFGVILTPPAGYNANKVEMGDVSIKNGATAIWNSSLSMVIPTGCEDLAAYCTNNQMQSRVVYHPYRPERHEDRFCRTHLERSDDRLKIAIMYQILKAFQYLHALGIRHLDMKPENVIILSYWGKYPMIKLSDWGFAEWLPLLWDPATYKLALDHGTRWYMAPEIRQPGFQTKEQDIYYTDEKVDIFAVAWIFLSVLFMDYGYTVLEKKWKDSGAYIPAHDKEFSLRVFFFENNGTPKPRFDALFREHMARDITPEERHLLRGLMSLDVKTRFSATEALQSTYFRTGPALEVIDKLNKTIYKETNRQDAQQEEDRKTLQPVLGYAPSLHYSLLLQQQVTPRPWVQEYLPYRTFIVTKMCEGIQNLEARYLAIAYLDSFMSSGINHLLGIFKPQGITLNSVKEIAAACHLIASSLIGDILDRSIPTLVDKYEITRIDHESWIKAMVYQLMKHFNQKLFVATSYHFVMDYAKTRWSKKKMLVKQVKELDVILRSVILHQETVFTKTASQISIHVIGVYKKKFAQAVEIDIPEEKQDKQEKRGPFYFLVEDEERKKKEKEEKKEEKKGVVAQEMADLKLRGTVITVDEIQGEGFFWGRMNGGRLLPYTVTIELSEPYADVIDIYDECYVIHPRDKKWKRDYRFVYDPIEQTYHGKDQLNKNMSFVFFQPNADMEKRSQQEADKIETVDD